MSFAIGTGCCSASKQTLALMGLAWAERTSGYARDSILTMTIVGIAGTAVAILFLFVVLGAFLDRELVERALDSAEE